MTEVDQMITQAEILGPLSVYTGPVEPLLRALQVRVKSNGDFLNMSHCPWCDHPGDNRFECGIAETPSGDGYSHAVKCWRSENVSYGDFLVKIGALSSWELSRLQDYFAQKPLRDQARAQRVRGATEIAAGRGAFAAAANDPAGHPPAEGYAEPAAPSVKRILQNDPKVEAKRKRKPSEWWEVAECSEQHARERMNVLLTNEVAMQWWTTVRGFDEELIRDERVGLSSLYWTTEEGVEVKNYALALMAPVRGIDGVFRKKYMYAKVPGVTEFFAKPDTKSWTTVVWAHYSAKLDSTHKCLFVCDGQKDLWALKKLIRGTDLENKLLVVTSTAGGGSRPTEWTSEKYWADWEYVYLGHDNDKANNLGLRAGDEHAQKIAKVAYRECHRVKPSGVKVKDWNDWTLNGGNIEMFCTLLQHAEPMLVKRTSIEQDDSTKWPEGTFEARPVSVIGNYHNGYLYEAVRVLRRERQGMAFVEYYDTIILRSDGQQLTVEEMPAPKGADQHAPVLRLSSPDGTLLSKRPEPNPYLTWRWESIKKWLDGHLEGKKPRSPNLAKLIWKVHGHLRSNVWLPFEDDYMLLTTSIVVSYCQAIFDAVPLFLLTGPPGTGKSEAFKAGRWLGANAEKMLGQSSAATLTRYVDQCRGLVLFDDLESIADTRDGAFSDLIQVIKLSYKKDTAVRIITNYTRGGVAEQVEFNFFGTKWINNTRGADAILNTRMIVIQTRRMPVGLDPTTLLPQGGKLQAEELRALRDDLHTWTFMNVQQIADTYQEIFPNKSTRVEEINAPLRVIAALSQDDEIMRTLERGLGRQERAKIDHDSPEQLMKEALEAIIRRSIEQVGVVQTWVTVTQLMLEMATLVDTNFGKEFTTSLAITERPDAVGKMLRQLYGDIHSEQRRTNLFGRSLRAHKLEPKFVQDMLNKIRLEAPSLFAKEPARSEDFKGFCRTCATCPYVGRCDDLQEERRKRDATRVGTP